MNINEIFSQQKVITVDELAKAFAQIQGASTERTDIETLIATIEELCGKFASPETIIVRYDVFDHHFALDFEAWAEEEGDYGVGKELMDAEAAYLQWLRPLCAEIMVGGVLFYLNHKLHLPEDWFYRRSAWQ